VKIARTNAASAGADSVLSGVLSGITRRITVSRADATIVANSFETTNTTGADGPTAFTSDAGRLVAR